MLPLHRTFKSLAFAIFPSFVFTSCSDDSKKHDEIVKALNESIESSNMSLNASTVDLMVSVQQKLYDYSTEERAQVWLPNAKKNQQLSKDIFGYIQNIKEKIKDSPVNSTELFNKLKLYKEQILAVDPKITTQFEKTINVFTKSINTSINDKEKLFNNYFKNTSSESIFAMLTKLQNNIKINELNIVTFCHEQIGKVSFGPCEADLPLVMINSSIVQPEEKMEIIAGNGTFYTNRNTKVFIYDRQIEIGENGVAEYKFNASSKPGRYFIPVRVNYLDQNGKQQTVQKEIEYTVANIQKQ